MLDKTIVITRPTGDGERLTEALHQLGARVVHEPLTDIYLRHQERQALQQALPAEPDAVLVTSRHGVQALALLTDIRDFVMLCVGEATAERALSLGFTRATNTGGTAERMARYVLDSYDRGTRFLYASGTDIRLPLDEMLNLRGMQVQRLALYEALAAQHLSDTLVEQLKRGQIDGITFMSQRAGQIFLRLLEKADAADVVSGLDAFCLSDQVANSLYQQPWRGIHAADEATLASLVQCVDNAFQNNS